MQSTGDWVKGYIGNKIIENHEYETTTDEGEYYFRSPKNKENKDLDQTGELKELICTERFLFDDDIKRNPYLFESDEFVRQKFLERKYAEYG